MNPTDKKLKSPQEAKEKASYYFGKIEIIPFEEMNLPEMEIAVYASADLGGGWCDGGGGDLRTCPVT